MQSVYFSQLVSANVGGLKVPEGANSRIAKLFGICMIAIIDLVYIFRHLSIKIMCLTISITVIAKPLRVYAVYIGRYP